jgi:hypothetical protein
MILEYQAHVRLQGEEPKDEGGRWAACTGCSPE